MQEARVEKHSKELDTSSSNLATHKKHHEEEATMLNITIKPILKGTRSGIHTQGDTQAHLLPAVVEEMFGTQPITVNLNCVGRMNIMHWTADINLIIIQPT